MAANCSPVFFTEEEYESYSMQPKFDVDLFQVYNPSIEGCAISPIKKSKLSHTQNVIAQQEVVELSSSAQPQPVKNPNSSRDQSQHGSPCDSQKPMKPSQWTLKSPKPQFPYPRYSCLTHAQQQRYIELWQKHGQRHPKQTRYSVTPDDITEKQQLRKLQILVHKEQQDFMLYAERVARCSLKDYEHVPPLALEYVKKQWKMLQQRVKKLPQYYSVFQTVGIAPAAVFPTDPVLTFSAHLLVLGQPCVVDGAVDSKVNQNLIVHAASNRLGRHGQSARGESGRGTELDMPEELSDDENAVKLATKYQASIVIATAALATLADNHAPGYDQNWQIPVHIKSTKISDTDSTVKTAFISGPLTNPYFPHEANRVFHQAALYDLLIQDMQGQSSLGDPRDEVNPSVNSRTSMGYGSEYDDCLELDLASLETFGSSFDETRKSKILQKAGGERKLSERHDNMDKDRGYLSSENELCMRSSSSEEQCPSTRGTSVDGYQFDSSRRRAASSSSQASETKTCGIAGFISGEKGKDDHEKRGIMSSQDTSSSSTVQRGTSSKELLQSDTVSPSVVDRTDKLMPSTETGREANQDMEGPPPVQLLATPVTDATAKVVELEDTSRECCSRISDQVPLGNSSEQCPEKGEKNPVESFAQDSKISLTPYQDSQTSELRLWSDSSEGDLVILSGGSEAELAIVSSHSESPQSALTNQFAHDKLTNEFQQINQCRKDKDVHCDRESLKHSMTEDKQQTDGDNLASRIRMIRSSSDVSLGVAIEDIPTPRRSKRLQKIQASEVGCFRFMPHPSGRIPEPSLPDEQAPPSKADDTKEGTRTATVDAVTGTIIPESPLSPPPHEQGLGTETSPLSHPSALLSVLSSPICNLPLTGRRGATSPREAPPHQIKKRRTDSPGRTETAMTEDKQMPCVGYNLRSKSGNQEITMLLESGVQDVNTDSKNINGCSSSGNASFGQSSTTSGKLFPDRIAVSGQEHSASKLSGNESTQGTYEKNLMNIDLQVNNNTKKSPTLKKQVKGKQTPADNKPGGETTIDSILKLQEQLHKGPSQPMGNVVSENTQTRTHGYVCMENASDYKFPSKGSVDYSLWCFGRHSVIVKSSIDAVTRQYGEDNISEAQVATIIPKMEYQPHFGLEQISTSELTKLWMRLLLQPGSKVIQGRVNALTSDLMMLEHFDMNSTLWEHPTFQPSRCMKMMFQILDKLTSLPEGGYLLCHSAGDMHACILQPVAPTGNTRALYDLHQTHIRVPMMQSCPPQLFPWLPLDTNLMLPVHVATGRIPGTFPPKNPAKNVKAANVSTGTSKKKKKRKKKGGKK